DVDGFIGQESMHGLQHRLLNDRLAELGYPTRTIGAYVRALTGFRERLQGMRVNLAYTTALEHYTATLAETLLTLPEAREAIGDNAVRSMLLWHALEESEHKAVAFDVFRAAGGTERMRINTMRAVNVVFLLGVIGHTIASLLGDRATYHPRVFRSFAALRHSPFLSRAVIRRIRDYNRVGFHPDDNDNTELVEHWRAELFGTDGVLADHLR